MEISFDDMQTQISRLLDRLLQEPKVPELRTIHMEVAPLLGQMQGAVGARRREVGANPLALEAEARLERIKALFRRVGADIRLASPGALSLGLRTVLEEAVELMDLLQKPLG